MDLSDIPFDAPVILRSQSDHKNLQNPVGSKLACCLDDNCDVYEHMILRRVHEDKIAIESARNGRFLQVRASGECVFDPKEPGEWELFTVKLDRCGALFFVSCHTGKFLQCGYDGVVQCSGEWRDGRRNWGIVEPRGVMSTIKASMPVRVNLNPERLYLIAYPARSKKSATEIEQIVMRLIDTPLAEPLASPTPTPMSSFADNQ